MPFDAGPTATEVSIVQSTYTIEGPLILSELIGQDTAGAEDSGLE